MAITMVRLTDEEADALLPNEGALDQPYVMLRKPGWFADVHEMKAWRDNRYRLIGYAPGQEPPLL
jgi:hypothetical protein